MLQNKTRRLMKDCCLGTQMPYVYQQDYDVQAPEGYDPFYIYYLGRHGGRSLDHPEEAEWICTVLSCAYEHQSLTIRGLELLSKLLNRLELENERSKEVNPIGVKNLEGIAHRMYLNYPKLYGRTIRTTAINEVRAVKSRNVFVKELTRHLGPKQISVHTKGASDPILNYCEADAEYLKYKAEGDWRKEYESFESRSHNLAEHILERIFQNEFFRLKCLNAEEKNRFVSQLYQLYTNQEDTNGVISLGYYFTPQEKYYYWENNNLKHYLLTGPGMNLPGGWASVAKPLLTDWMKCCDEAIQSRRLSVDVSFTNEKTLLSLTTALKLQGMCEATCNPYRAALLWKDYQIAPIAANLQWVFYKPVGQEHLRADEIIVLVKQNEVPAVLPIPALENGCYRWIDVKEYYGKMIS